MALKRPRSESLRTNYSPRPRNSDLFSNASPLATKDNLFSLSKNLRKGQIHKTVELIEQSEGRRTVRLYQTYELYFVPTDIHKGKQFCVKEIRVDNVYGIDFGKLGIGKGWLLTKIGNDVNATKLLFAVTRNKLLNLAKLAKKAGYQLTFEGIELSAIIEEKDEEKHTENVDKKEINIPPKGDNNKAHIVRHFIDDTDDLPLIPEPNLNQMEGVIETDNKNVIQDDHSLPMLPDNNDNNDNNGNDKGGNIHIKIN